MKMTHEQFNKALGKRLYSYRKLHRLTMDELAQKAGVAKSTIHATEHANSMPSIYSLVKMCDGMGISIGILINDVTQFEYTNEGKIKFPLAEERNDGSNKRQS